MLDINKIKKELHEKANLLQLYDDILFESTMSFADKIFQTMLSRNNVVELSTLDVIRVCCLEFVIESLNVNQNRE